MRPRILAEDETRSRTQVHSHAHPQPCTHTEISEVVFSLVHVHKQTCGARWLSLTHSPTHAHTHSQTCTHIPVHMHVLCMNARKCLGGCVCGRERTVCTVHCAVYTPPVFYRPSMKRRVMPNTGKLSPYSLPCIPPPTAKLYLFQRIWLLMHLPLLLRWVCKVAGVLRNDLQTMVRQGMVQNDLRPTPQPQHLSPRLQPRLLQCLVSAGEVICVVVCVNCNGESIGV